MNRDRFVKLIALAESNQDHEALAAVRKASEMARAAGLSLGQAVTSASGTAPRDYMAEIELTMARARIVVLERQLAAGADEAQLVTARAEGYGAGHKAGKAATDFEARGKAGQRIAELEAQLEAYRPSLDWLPLAERFVHKNQRGRNVDYAKFLLLRARTNKLTATDQAELRKFAARRLTNKPKV
ncbi:MAG TPA: hypothetical protein VK558_05120 [Patescibacteria group bacterium]|nr:hypothetical protein [Patescibacteria group bacterium]